MKLPRCKLLRLAAGAAALPAFLAAMPRRASALGASLLSGSSADFGKLIAAETEKWGKVIRFAGIKPE
jgi:hypothetical protein